MPIKNKNTHPEDIKARVRKQYISLRGLAKMKGVSSAVVHAAVHRPQPSGNHVIAKALGTTVHILWPEWFDKEGNRIRSKNKIKSIRKQTKRQRQNARSN